MPDSASEVPLSTADQFEDWWQTQGEWVEEPNQRRGGESGVQRVRGRNGELLYVKRQVGHAHRSLRHPFGRPTVLREREALLSARQAGVNVPDIVYCSTSGKRGLLVTAALDGYLNVDDWYASGGRERYGEAMHERLLKAIGSNIALFNRARWQHSSTYSKHIFVCIDGQGENAKPLTALIDLEKSRQRLTAKQAALHDMKQLRRRSNWSREDWKVIIDAYQQTFGCTLSELPD
ncbi:MULTISPECIES: lipopolysaccharide kinase InaA family protein [Pseudomonas]|uniref:lipopolysaccharide kinase InaA family protein n=1 Tax=Pseudomonas TaxID=286 RepID=UPI002580CD58|nr:lipopolysaccharide kinase InaA family protein [Pseudomonas sp.]